MNKRIPMKGGDEYDALTLQEIRDHSPCQSDWKKLTKAVGNDMTTKLSIGDVVISNGLDDGALWCLRCLDLRKRVAAIIPAVKRAAVHSKDQRVHDCVKDIEKWLAGDNSINLYAAWAAAGSAARTAAGSAEGSHAERIAAWSAARAARTAAWAAAADAAAVDAAGSAARAAASAVGEAAGSAARTAAWAEERELQKSDLLKMFPPMILKGETE